MLLGVGATCFLLPCRPVIRHAITDSLLFHIILHTIHPSFLWPPSSNPSIYIYIHNSFGHMHFIPPLHMPIPSQTVSFQLFCHWRYFQTSSNILIPYLIHSGDTTHPSQHSQLRYMQSSFVRPYIISFDSRFKKCSIPDFYHFSRVWYYTTNYHPKNMCTQFFSKLHIH